MRTKNAQNSLSDSAYRLGARLLYERELVENGGDAMSAYHTVGIDLGTSRARGLIKGYPGHSFTAGVRNNISKLLPKLADRIMANAVLERDVVVAVIAAINETEEQAGEAALRECDAPSLSESPGYQMEEANP